MTLSNSSPSLFLLPLLLALSSPASALQILDAKDGETVLGKISQKEVTRISVERGRIRKVTGNTGEFVLEKDEEKGQIFIRPVSPESTKPINLFITSERSTIGLVLQPVDTPSDTLVIREETRDPLTSTSRMEKSGRHVRTIKNLLLAMAGDARCPTTWRCANRPRNCRFGPAFA
jgi:conjugal transfer pilus assembly protein TraK